MTRALRYLALLATGAATHGHQRENAVAFQEAGAARVIEEPSLTAEVLAGAVTELFADRARLCRMGEAARSLAVPDAARRLADLLFEAEGVRAR